MDTNGNLPVEGYERRIRPTATCFRAASTTLASDGETFEFDRPHIPREPRDVDVVLPIAFGGPSRAPDCLRAAETFLVLA